MAEFHVGESGELTFNQDHIDVDGAGVWLWQSLAFLQGLRNLSGNEILVRLFAICKHLPQRYTYDQIHNPISIDAGREHAPSQSIGLS